MGCRLEANEESRNNACPRLVPNTTRRRNVLRCGDGCCYNTRGCCIAFPGFQLGARARGAAHSNYYLSDKVKIALHTAHQTRYFACCLCGHNYGIIFSSCAFTINSVLFCTICAVPVLT